MQFEGLDAIDNHILEVISENARLSYSEIGKIVSLSRVAVKNRMDQMEKNGVIRGYRTVIEAKNVPESIQFFLDLETDPEQMGAVCRRLAGEKMIRQVYLLSGNCRIHAVGLAPNQNTLQVFAGHFFRNQKGVRKMSYSSVLCTLKDLDGGIGYGEDDTENIDRAAGAVQSRKQR